MEPQPNFSRREDLVGKHDSKSVSLKFLMLPEEIKTSLDDALNNAGLAFDQCFSENFLESLTDEQRKELSNLNSDLNPSVSMQNETIKSIVGILNSWANSKKYISSILSRHESKGCAGFTTAARAAYAVHVGVVSLWHVVVNDMSDVGNI